MKHVDIKAETAYRPDIDGLRCIAVMLVVAYHLFPKAVRGGFIGVDIFFVISGYLITSILWSDLRKGTYSIVSFYQRRIRRIFPALIVVLAATLGIGWFILSPEELLSLGQTIIGGATFSANIVLLNQISYFDIAAENKPLLHLWSLGVEEQFYIAWPLILYAAYKRKLNLLTLVCVIMLASFILNIALVYKLPDQAFYLPFTRAWELAVGAALVFFRDLQRQPMMTAFAERADRMLARIVWDGERKPSLPHVASDFRAAIGLILVIVGAFRLTAYIPFPGYAALLPVIGAALLISAPDAIFNRHVLSSRPFVMIGLISYPFYLWHYPLIAYVKLISNEAPSWPVLLGVGIASAALAWLTYVAIEKPIRFGTFTKARAAQLSAAMAALATLGGVVWANNGFESRVPEAIRSYVTENTGGETSTYWRQGRCLLLPEQGASQFGAECAETARPLLVLWGDSYAAALYPGIKSLQNEINFGIAQFTASACPPAVGFIRPGRSYCRNINDEIANKIDQMRPDIVVLHSMWLTYDLTMLEPYLTQTVSKLRASGVKRIVILGLVPSWRGRSLPQNLLDYYMRDSSHPLLPARTHFRLYPSEEPNDHLKAIATRLGVQFISALDQMCNTSGCLARVGDAPRDLTAFDTGHLTISGSVFLARAIKDQLFGN